MPESKDTSAGHVAVDGHVDCCADQTHYSALSYREQRMVCKCIAFCLKINILTQMSHIFVGQVVELISSAIGDVVQGIYSENHNNIEVKHLFQVFV